MQHFKKKAKGARGQPTEAAQKGNPRLRRLCGWLAALALVALNSSPSVQSLRSLPDTMRLQPGQAAGFSFLLPLQGCLEQESQVAALSGDERLGTVKLTGEALGEANLTLSVLGLPVKRVRVEVEPERRLLPGGQAIGITMYTQGVFVVDCAAVYQTDGTRRNPAAEAGLQSGDTIERVNGEMVRNLGQLTSAVQSSTAKTLKLTVRRGSHSFDARVTPVVDEDGVRRLGLWARDSTAGIGTLTYIDPAAQRFGALGHAITDVDTLQLLSVREGDVYLSRIVDVKKGAKGEPGELHGVFLSAASAFGTIRRNTEVGVFGAVRQTPVSALYPEGLLVGDQSMVRPGPATLLSTIDETGVQAFDCEITRVTPQLSSSQRSMVLRVTDERLLASTGGIVQGMSGSPILQNGHIVGAVTHVYVNDPTRGYGIFIQWMLDEQ